MRIDVQAEQLEAELGELESVSRAKVVEIEVNYSRLHHNKKRKHVYVGCPGAPPQGFRLASRELVIFTKYYHIRIN